MAWRGILSGEKVEGEVVHRLVLSSTLCVSVYKRNATLTFKLCNPGRRLCHSVLRTVTLVRFVCLPYTRVWISLWGFIKEIFNVENIRKCWWKTCFGYFFTKKIWGRFPINYYLLFIVSTDLQIADTSLSRTPCLSWHYKK